MTTSDPKADGDAGPYWPELSDAEIGRIVRLFEKYQHAGGRVRATTIEHPNSYGAGDGWGVSSFNGIGWGGVTGREVKDAGGVEEWPPLWVVLAEFLEKVGVPGVALRPVHGARPAPPEAPPAGDRPRPRPVDSQDWYVPLERLVEAATAARLLGVKVTLVSLDGRPGRAGTAHCRVAGIEWQRLTPEGRAALMTFHRTPPGWGEGTEE